jgi:hypothetical protein
MVDKLTEAWVIVNPEPLWSETMITPAVETNSAAATESAT